MKNFWALAAAALFVVFSFVRCSDDDDHNFYPDFSFIPVSVVNNGGVVKFVSDDDVILIPVNASDYNYDFWKSCKRALINFRSSVKSFEPGKEYSIELGGTCYSIPLYSCQDLAVAEDDTLSERSMNVKSLKVNDSEFASIANGFLNIVPSFFYDPRNVVSFALFCNTDSDVDPVAKNIDLNLYFNCNSASPTLSMSGTLISFQLLEDFHHILRNKGVADSDSVTVSLHYSALDASNGCIVIPVKLEDLDGVK